MCKLQSPTGSYRRPTKCGGSGDWRQDGLIPQVNQGGLHEGGGIHPMWEVRVAFPIQEQQRWEPHHAQAYWGRDWETSQPGPGWEALKCQAKGSGLSFSGNREPAIISKPVT